MIVYLSARYERAEEMRALRTRLHEIPRIEVRSHWLDEKPNALPIRCAYIDRADIRSSDALIAFTETGSWPRGGRHVEFGIAWEAGKKLWVVGPEENIFHTMAHERFADAEEMILHLKGLHL